MKVRSMFVSNSSSSSFVCDISGHQMVIYNDEWSEYDVAACVNGHSFLRKYLVGDNPHDEDSDDYYDWWWQVDRDCCPICRFDVVTDKMIVDCFEKKGTTREKWAEHFREEFGTFEAFQEWLKDED